jgi:toxin YoeB
LPASRAVQYHKFEAINEPRTLNRTHELAGAWSRRIDSEHRLVYTVADEKIRIVACRYHY